MVKTWAENVAETSNTTGTSPYELAGSILGHRSFVAAGFNTGDKPLYVVRNALNTKYEFNSGATFTNSTPDTLARGTYLSSNSNNPVVWAAGDLPLTIYIPSIAFDSSGNLLVMTDGAALGYATGTGGAVTQITSKATSVTLSKATGKVTMHNAALAAGAKVTFTILNSTLLTEDGAIVWVDSGGTANAYRASVTSIGHNQIGVTVENITGGSLSEAPVIGFAVIKSAIT